MASGSVISGKWELLASRQAAGEETFTIDNLDDYRYFCLRCTYQTFDNNLDIQIVPKEWFKYPPDPPGLNSAIRACWGAEPGNYIISAERTAQNKVKIITKGQYDLARFYGMR
jgi:hypothetical protein